MKLSFDTHLTDSVGFGRGQLTQFLILSLIDFIDGFAIIFMTILLQILKVEWNLTQSQVIILATVYFIGMTVGLIISGLYADSLGRKNMLSLSMFATFICVIWHAYAQTYNEVLILRFAFGCFFGSSIHLSLILMSEQIPLAYRGRVVVTLQLVYLLGMYYMFLCGWIFLVNLEEGNWRAIFLMNSIPVFLCFLGSIFLVEESPRFSLIHAQYQRAFQRLDRMGYLNNTNFNPLTITQKDSLIKWQIQMRQMQNSRNISDLFNEQNKIVTILLWAIMLLWNLQCASIFIIAPFVLSASGNGLFSMFISYIWELPAQIFVFLTIDSQKWGGRKRMVIYGLSLFIAAEFYIYSYKANAIVIGLALIRVADKLVWLALNQLKIESYLTYYRTLGVGMAESIGKVASSFASFLVFSIFYIDPYLPFLVLGLMSFVTLALVALFPVDLTQQPLDDGLIPIQPET